MAKSGRIYNPRGQLPAQNTKKHQKSPLVQVFNPAKEFLHHTRTQQPPLPCPTSVLTRMSLQTSPLVPPLPVSSFRESDTRGGLSAEQLFISLCRGNLGLFMEIQTLLNNRCSSEKENFFCFGQREGWRGLFLRQFGNELNVCSGI